jgi:hypothetical protein
VLGIVHAGVDAAQAVGGGGARLLEPLGGEAGGEIRRGLAGDALELGSLLANERRDLAVAGALGVGALAQGGLAGGEHVGARGEVGGAALDLEAAVLGVEGAAR